MHIFGLIYWGIAIGLFVFIVANWDNVGGEWSRLGFLVVTLCIVLWPVGIPGALYVAEHEDEIQEWIEKQKKK